jgi:hypothetical protein
LPEWFTEELYREKIQPELATVKISAIISALGVSEPYAAEIGKKEAGAASEALVHRRANRWNHSTAIEALAAQTKACYLVLPQLSLFSINARTSSYPAKRRTVPSEVTNNDNNQCCDDEADHRICGVYEVELNT